MPIGITVGATTTVKTVAKSTTCVGRLRQDVISLNRGKSCSQTLMRLRFHQALPSRQGVGNNKGPGSFSQASWMFSNVDFVASTETIPGVRASPRKFCNLS